MTAYILSTESSRRIREQACVEFVLPGGTAMKHEIWSHIALEKIWIDQGGERMIPKKGEIVRISEKFIKTFDTFNDGSTVCADLKSWISAHRGKDLEVAQLSISAYGGFVVSLDEAGADFILTKEGYLHCWRTQLTVPFFTSDRTSAEAQSHMYCSCASPKLKDVFISASIYYKFCDVCKKERK
jgi:hypothetical protein